VGSALTVREGAATNTITTKRGAPHVEGGPTRSTLGSRLPWPQCLGIILVLVKEFSE